MPVQVKTGGGGQVGWRLGRKRRTCDRNGTNRCQEELTAHGFFLEHIEILKKLRHLVLPPNRYRRLQGAISTGVAGT
jgi:hypothetical protein